MRTRSRRSGTAALALMMAAVGCSSRTTASIASSTTPAPPTAAPTVATPASPTTTTPSSTAATATAPTSSTVVPTTASAPAPPPAGITRIEVPSTVEQYFVLYLKPDLDAAREIPVSITRGQAGTTVLTDGRAQLPAGHYRVDARSVADPGDVDGDGIDDLTELANPPTMNPLNAAKAIDLVNGTTIIPDAATFSELSYQGPEVAIDRHLVDLEFVKFYLVDVNTDQPKVYFMNTVTHRAHFRFASAVGIPGGRGPNPGQMRGEIVYHRDVPAPDGTLGVYRFEFEPNDSYPFAEVQLGYELLASSMPFLTNNLVYYPMPQAALPRYEREKVQFDAYRLRILLERDIVAATGATSPTTAA